MALESATFFVTDCYDRHYKVHAISDTIGGNECLWCKVYKAIGCYVHGDAFHSERKMDYEEEYSADFNIYIEDCLNLDDENEVETIIQNKFNDTYWVTTWIDDAMIYAPTKEEIDAEVKADILQCKAKKILADYHNLDLEYMSVEGALSDLSKIARKMAEFIEENFGK